MLDLEMTKEVLSGRLAPLFRWWTLRGHSRPDFHPRLSETARVDPDFDTWLWWVEQSLPAQEVDLVEFLEKEDCEVLVFDFVDPVTNLLHRVSWVARFANEQIVGLTETVSAGRFWIGESRRSIENRGRESGQGISAEGGVDPTLPALGVEVLSTATNGGIVRMPGRRFPGVVIQGDTLNSLRRTVADAAARVVGPSGDLEEAAAELEEILSSLDLILADYEERLADAGFSLPYPRD